MAIVRLLSTLLEGKVLGTRIVTKTWDDFQVIDPKAFRTQTVFGGDLYYIGGGLSILIILLLLLMFYRSYRTSRISSHLKKYNKRKSQSKLIALKMSEDVSDAVTAIAKKTNATTDSFLADNRNFERSVNQLKSENPSDSLLGMVQSIREQADFKVSNPQVAFICSQMLEPSMQVRVFVHVKGKDHSFLSRVLRVTESELWVQPPKVKRKVINLSQFKKVEIRLYRPQDGEYSFVCDLKRQIRIPVHGLVLNHTLAVQRMSQRKQERVPVQLERKIGFYIPKMDSQFSFGETELVANTVTIVDISSGGLRVETEDVIDGVDIDIEVVTSLPEVGIRRKIRSKIVRIDRPENSKLIYLHLMFTSLNERNRHLLEKFIHSLKVSGNKAIKKPTLPKQLKEAVRPVHVTEGLEQAAQEAEASPIKKLEDLKKHMPELEEEAESIDDSKTNQTPEASPKKENDE